MHTAIPSKDFVQDFIKRQMERARGLIAYPPEKTGRTIDDKYLSEQHRKRYRADKIATLRGEWPIDRLRRLKRKSDIAAARRECVELKEAA